MQVAVGVGALAFVVVRSDPAALMAAMRQTRAAYLPLTFLATLLTTWLMAYRWRLILEVRGHGVRTSRLFRYYLIGMFFANFVPGGSVTGDVARLVYADRDVGDKAFVLSTLVFERMVGIFTLLLIGLGATIASGVYRPAGSLVYAGEAVLAVGLAGSAMLMSKRVSSWLAGVLIAVGERLGVVRLGEAASRTVEAIAQFRGHKRMLAVTFGLSVLIRVGWGLGCYVVAVAMGLPVGPLVIFAFIALVDLVRTMPISIGGLGVREWLFIVLFANLGVAREQALMFSFLAMAPIVLNAVVGGILYTAGAGRIEGLSRESRTEPRSARA